MDLKRLEALFHAACDLEPGERKVYLDSVLGDDPAYAELRRKLDAMLRTADAGDETLPRPVVVSSGGGTGSDVNGLPELEPGARVGRYRLIERLGEGGFGVVYRPSSWSRCGAKSR